MPIEVYKARGLSEVEAIQDAVEKGLVVYVGDFDEGFPDELHWHKWDTHLYCLSGEIKGMEPGDYFVVPAKTLHAGQVVKKTRIVNAFTPNVFDEIEINQPPEKL